MTEFQVAVAMVAPYYNLGFTIVVIYLFVQLFRTYREGQGVYFAPWGYVFAAVMIFVLEEVITILRQAGLIEIPLHINGFFELVIISVFIYALLLQRDWIRQAYTPVSIPSVPISVNKISSSKSRRR